MKLSKIDLWYNRLVEVFTLAGGEDALPGQFVEDKAIAPNLLTGLSLVTHYP